MDERLREVHQTDLTESRVNEEFVDWLKTKGLTWLLVALLLLCAFLVIIRWREHKANYRAEAWAAYLESEQSGLPSSFEGVAEEYGDVGAIPQLARIRAAGRLIRSVQTGQTLASTPESPVTLSPDERTRYLDRADGIYAEVLAADDGTLGMTLLAVSALNGRAAIAECKGDTEATRSGYLAAADRAEAYYPGLAEQSRARADTAGAYDVAVELPRQSEIVRPVRQPLDPVLLDESIRDLLMPTDG